MKVQTTYNLTVNEEEIRIFVSALHKEYKDLCNSGKPNMTEKIDKTRELRNTMAALVNISYMGADA